LASRRGIISSLSRRRAEGLEKQGLALSDQGDVDGALDLYLRALALDAERPETLYNVGLIYKYRQAWAQSFDFNRRSLELDPDSEAARWNLAIAATALGDWPTARQMWAQCGYEIEPGNGPIEDDFGPTPVRLNPEGDQPEVVWARRIDPVRARIQSVPFPQSGYFFGDIVLHDGAAQGYRKLGDSERPVFNVFQRLERSLYATHWGQITAPSQVDFDTLEKACDGWEIVCEDWTSNTQFLCKQCSEGVPHERHDQELPEPVWIPQHEVAFAATNLGELQAVLMDWSTGPGRAVGEMRSAS